MKLLPGGGGCRRGLRPVPARPVVCRAEGGGGGRGRGSAAALRVSMPVGTAALQRAQEIAGLKTVISAAAFKKRLKDFPWPENVVQLDELLPGLKTKILCWWIAAVILPAFVHSSGC